MNSKYKHEIRNHGNNAFLDKSPSVHEIEQVVEKTEANKLLSYYNKNKHILQPARQDIPSFRASIESRGVDEKMTKNELEPASIVFESYSKTFQTQQDDDKLTNPYDYTEDQDTQ